MHSEFACVVLAGETHHEHHLQVGSKANFRNAAVQRVVLRADVVPHNAAWNERFYQNVTAYEWPKRAGENHVTVIPAQHTHRVMATAQTCTSGRAPSDFD